MEVASEPCCAPFNTLPAAVLTGASSPAEEAARIDAYLRDLLGRSVPHKDELRIRTALTALIDEDMTSVAELAQRPGISSRSLERLSLKAFGFSPRLLLRRQRFLRSLAQYVDQAHFVRDFRRFMAMSSRRYAALDHPVLRAAAQGRTAAAGAAVQALHRP